MADLDGMVVNLGFRVNEAERDDAMAKLQPMLKLVEALKELEALGLKVTVEMVDRAEPAGANF